jgi:hypothetical protein
MARDLETLERYLDAHMARDLETTVPRRTFSEWEGDPFFGRGDPTQWEPSEFGENNFRNFATVVLAGSMLGGGGGGGKGGGLGEGQWAGMDIPVGDTLGLSSANPAMGGAGGPTGIAPPAGGGSFWQNPNNLRQMGQLTQGFNQGNQQPQQQPQNLFARSQPGVLTTGPAQPPTERPDVALANALIVQQAMENLQRQNGLRGGLYGLGTNYLV